MEDFEAPPMDDYQYADLESVPGMDGAGINMDPAMLMMVNTIGIVFLVFLVFMLVCNWKIFVKAGKPGWASLIPIYNAVVFMQIINRPAWWILLFFVPFVNIVITVITMLDLGKAFSKDSTFSILGLVFFTPVGMAMLAFSDAKYIGRKA